MENVITLGKIYRSVVVLSPLLSVLFLKTPKIQGMTCPLMGNIFQVVIIVVVIGRAKRAPHGVFNRDFV